MGAVTVAAGRGEDLGQAVQELQGRETQGGATGGVGPREEVEELIGVIVDQVESVESEGRPGTIPNEPFEAGPVGGLDADAGVQAKAATVIPGQHVLGVVGLQEAVASKMPEDPFSNGVLEALQEFAGEGCGLVEAEVGFWVGRILIGIILGPLEEPVDHAQVVVEMRI